MPPPTGRYEASDAPAQRTALEFALAAQMMLAAPLAVFESARASFADAAQRCASGAQGRR